MRQFLLLMHGDTTSAEDGDAWGPYLAGLRASGHFDGGSSIGPGHGYRNAGGPAADAGDLVGYLIVRAVDAESARSFLNGNPVYEAGGTVEIRDLIED